MIAQSARLRVPADSVRFAIERRRQFAQDGYKSLQCCFMRFIAVVVYNSRVARQARNSGELPQNS